MAISNAQFSAWLLRDAARVVVAKIAYAYESGGALAEGALYVGTAPYVTKPYDVPSNEPCRDAILSTPTFSRRVDVGTLGGRGDFSISDLVLANADGELDDLLRVVLDGWPVTFYLGDPAWPFADFRVVLVAVAERVAAPDLQTIVVKLRDKRLLLDREVKGDAVGGSGPNATKYLPLLWGSHFNVEALLYDATALTYAVVSNYEAASLAVDVRDSGVSLRSGGWSATSANTTVNAGTDVFTKTAHGLAVDDVIFFADPVVVGETYFYWAPFPGMSARPYWVKTVPTADTFTLSATKGGATLDVTATTWSDTGSGVLAVVRQRFFDDLATTGRIQLSSTPDGRVTVDVLNQGNVTAPFALALELVETYGNLEAAEIDSAAFTAADAALDAKIALGYSNFAVRERRNLLDVLDELIDACFGWVGVSGAGLVTCGILDPSGLDSATVEHELAAEQVLAGLSCENLPVTISRVNVNHGYNHTVQADGLATSVTVESRAEFGGQYRNIQRSTAPSGTTYAANKPLYHKTMVEGAPRAAALMSTSAYGTDSALPISNYADEIVADRRPHLQVLSFVGGLDLYEWGLGEVVEITYPRYGLDGGKRCRVVGIDVDLANESVAVDLLAYTAPDTTTSSYH